MAEVATLYQLREKCDYVVALVETFPSTGFPYHKATKYLFTQPHADLHNFIETTTEYYAKELDKNMFFCYTIGLYRMEKMAQLAKATKKCMNEYPYSYAKLSAAAWASINNESLDMLMRYPWEKTVPSQENDYLFYDFRLLINQIRYINP